MPYTLGTVPHGGTEGRATRDGRTGETCQRHQREEEAEEVTEKKTITEKKREEIEQEKVCWSTAFSATELEILEPASSMISRQQPMQRLQ